MNNLHITMTTEVVSASETSTSFYQTTPRNIPEDSPLHIRRRENLKFLENTFFFISESTNGPKSE
jgi:hypothetical protein